MSRAKVDPETGEILETRSKPSGKWHTPTEADRERVGMLAAFGNTHDEIAMLLGVSLTTLKKHYKQELDTGRVAANEKVARCLFDEATSGRGRERVRAQEFWLKNRAGWKDQKATEISGPDGGPIPTNLQIEFVEPIISSDD